MQHSIVEQFSENSRESCGYCKRTGFSQSYGMFAQSLTIDDYQSLIDRGWRRSGIYCYKPVMDETCCPAYTIKCDTENFKLSKSQKKNLNKFNKCVTNDQIVRKSIEDIIEEAESKSMVLETPSSEVASVSNLVNDHTIDKSSIGESNKTGVKKGNGIDPNKTPCKKAKLLRLEKKQAKMKNPKSCDMANEKLQNQEKSLEEFLADLPKEKLKIKLVKTAPPGNEWKDTENVSHSLYQKYQMIIHGDSPQKCSKNQFKRFLVNSPLKIKLIEIGSRDFFKSFNISWNLYRKYQMIIHKEKSEECDSESFKDFLVESPLKAETRDSVDFGSFHQQYWLNNELVAVGVIDILPKCVSSVYFFYDPTYSDLSLGTYGALREIEFTRKLQKKCSTLKYYYMGFYIHSCPKMRYKGNYCPSYLLCPETYKWFPIKDCVGKLDEKKYSRLNPNRDETDWNEFEENDVNQLQVLSARSYKRFPYGNLKQLQMRYEELYRENMIQYGKLIGKECSQRLLLLVPF